LDFLREKGFIDEIKKPFLLSFYRGFNKKNIFVFFQTFYEIRLSKPAIRRERNAS